MHRQGQIELRNTDTLALVKKMKPPENGGIGMLAFSSARPLMASAWDRAHIVLWNTQSWKPETDWDPNGKVRSLTFSPDGAAVVTGMDDTRIVVWDVATGSVKHTVNEPVTTIVCSSQRGLFATANLSTVRLWNRDLEPIGEPFETLATVNSLAFSANGNRLVAGTGGDNRILVWDIGQQPSLVLAHTIRGHSGSIESVAFGGDNDTVWSSSYEGWLKQWDLSSCEPCRTLTHVPGASQVVYTDDGQTLLIIDQSGIAHRWQVEADASLGPLNPGREYTQFAVSDDGSTLAGATENGDLEIWDVPAGVVRTKRLLSSSDLQFLAVTPNGSSVVYNYGGNVVEVWDLDTGKTKLIPFAAGLPVISLDGRLIALSTWDTTQLWKIAADPPQMLAELRGWGEENCKAFSPSGDTLAVGSNRDNIRLHDTETGELKFNLKGHNGSVSSVAFSSDGKSIVSGGDDRTVRIWDIESGNAVATFHGHASEVRSVDFSPQDTSVASCSVDGTVRIWTAADKRAVNQDIQSWIERVRYFTELKDWKKAHKIMAEAVKLAPDIPHVFAARGHLYDRQGHWADIIHGQTESAIALRKAAIDDCSRAVNLSPNDGKLLAQRGQYSRATWAGRRSDRRLRQGTAFVQGDKEQSVLYADASCSVTRPLGFEGSAVAIYNRHARRQLARFR